MKMIGETDIQGSSCTPDLLLVNTPLRDYGKVPRSNDFTLPTLGLGYIATCVENVGFSVGVLDAEAAGMSLSKTSAIINQARPRWVGLNLLAPTYRNSVQILSKIDGEIMVMLGGHQAKAMPRSIVADERIPKLDALVVGEGETRVPLLLEDHRNRTSLPAMHWRENGEYRASDVVGADPTYLSPDINSIPILDRRFLMQDPYVDAGVRESAIVGSRGCPFDCSFCGAAISANRDVRIRSRSPENLLHEMRLLKTRYHVDRVRFVDDLFLANPKMMRGILNAFIHSQIGMRWDATGRINVLSNAKDDLIDLMRLSGCREVALGIESGSDRLLNHIDKKISTAQIRNAVRRLCEVGIDVKGYFILGLPTETRVEQEATIDLIRELWDITSSLPGSFRCSAFSYRPYPGTPDWARLLASGYIEDDLLSYATSEEVEFALDADRDEFDFTTSIQFGEVPVAEIRSKLHAIMKAQKEMLV